VLVIPRAFVCPSEAPCDPAPFSGTLAFSRSGRVVARVRVAGGRRLAVHLASGRYAIRFLPAPRPWTLAPAAARVPRTAAVSLRLTLVR